MSADASRLACGLFGKTLCLYPSPFGRLISRHAYPSSSMYIRAELPPWISKFFSFFILFFPTEIILVF